MASKVSSNMCDALSCIESGMTLAVGGFGLCGIPENLIQVLSTLPVKDLTIISNNCGVDDFGLGLLLKTKQIKKMISSYVGENQTFMNQYLDGSLEVDLVPQGTLAERLRASGAGIPAFYTPTGFGTMVAEGKESRYFGGRGHILEHAFQVDVALVKAWRGDAFGNLVYRKTARNFNPAVASAGRITIVEVEKLEPLGTIDADHVHTPGVLVNTILKGEHYEKRIEQRTIRTR